MDILSDIAFISGTQIAGMLEGILSWLTNFIPGGGLVLGAAATILLLAGIVRGLFDWR